MKTLPDHFRPVAACVGLVAALAACHPADKHPAGHLEAPAEALAITAEKKMATAKMTMREQVAHAIVDLANSRGVEPETIVVVNARPVTWRSGAIGCPQPGMSYTEALVPGVSILLRSGEEISAYHAVVGGEPFPCPLDRVELPVYGEGSDQV
jgi:hypothetical protein